MKTLNDLYRSIRAAETHSKLRIVCSIIEQTYHKAGGNSREVPIICSYYLKNEYYYSNKKLYCNCLVTAQFQNFFLLSSALTGAIAHMRLL
jgi:hypothetical protein